MSWSRFFSFYPLCSTAGLSKRSIWLRMSTSLIASVFWISRSRGRKQGQAFRLYRDIAASTKARRLQPEDFCQAKRL